jgi:benzoylformate decarboxylase
VAILGDPKATLPDLLDALATRMTPATRRRAHARLEMTRAAKAQQVDELRARARAEAGRSPMTALAAIAAVADALPPEAVVVDETISSGAGLRTLLRSDDARSFYGLRGGGIGWGLPAAIGVKLALPARPVVGLIGDGSAMYTCQALWTAARYRVGVTFVILNNSSYRILKQRIHAMKGLAAQSDTYVAMDLEDPRVDFVRLAESLGVRAERIEKATEVGPAVGRALATPGPTLLDVELDRTFKPA